MPDFNALKLPGKPGDEFEDDFVLLADVFPTGYHASEQAHVHHTMLLKLNQKGA